MDIGNRIKQFREEKNLTQKDIAKILEVEPGTISKYESNLIEPNIRSLIKLSDTFQISVDELLKDEEVYFDLNEIDILATLQEQKDINLDGNLYHNTRRRSSLRRRPRACSRRRMESDMLSFVNRCW